MSRYLDHDGLPAILERHYGDEKMRRCRSVGAQRQFESAYFDFVRFFGGTAVSPSRIHLTYEQQIFEFRDPLVRDFAAYAERELRAEGRLYHGPQAMKLMSCNLKDPSPLMKVQPARYGDNAGSCFALDLRHKLFEAWGGTLRHYMLKADSSHALEKNPLAVCLGVAGYLLVPAPEGEALLQVKRSGRLASLEESYGPSVAGSVDFCSHCRSLDQLLADALAGELEEELAIRPGEYEVVPLAFAREILRGDRPQLFALIKCKLSREEVVERISSIPEPQREFSSCHFQRLSGGRLPFEEILSLNFEAQVCYYLLEEYLALQG